NSTSTDPETSQNLSPSSDRPLSEVDEASRPRMGGEPMSIERIPTHVEGLDENIQGGIPEGHIAIVAGS
ncbi:MAG TPA: hypothetical protein D7H96_05655, partial [Candidatus Poseidoniales archaeon]